MNIVSDNNVWNGKLINKSKLNDLLSCDTAKIYEVIRVVNKHPVFMREHFDRMVNSIHLSGVPGNIKFADFCTSIKILIENNNFENCNIRISYFFDNEPNVLYYFIESYYPTREQFVNGVHTVTAKIQRNNPNIKAYQKEFKEATEKIMQNSDAFEVILVNDDGTVSEGSRSSIFFVKDKTLITAKDENVLLGVTRNKVIEVSEKNKIMVEKRIINFEELKQFDAAFITGTSNDVLPIKTIDDIIYDSAGNEIVKKASELYLKEMEKSI